MIKKKNHILILYILIGMLSNIRCSNPKDVGGISRIDSRMVVVNIVNADRLRIANAIEQLNNCSSKVIAMNVLFETTTTIRQDSILYDSFKRKKNIILPFVVTDTGLIKSDKFFNEACLDQGISELWPFDEVINSFKVSIYSERNNEVYWSFPFAVVNHFDGGNASYIKEAKPLKSYYFNLTKDDIKLTGISLDSLSAMSCDKLSDKLIIMGDIIPNDPNGFLTEADPEKRVSSTIIFSKIISTILNHDFQEID